MRHFKKIIVTAGGTREWIDPVRFISNASTGKMGYSIASELVKQNYPVVYIHGSVSDKYSYLDGAKNISVETTLDLLNAILSEFEDETLLIMAAAPADFKPKSPSNSKIKKKENSSLILELEPNPDILKTLKQHRIDKQLNSSVLIGFAAETNDLEQNAKEKLLKKGLKYIIANPIKEDSGFGEKNTSIKIFSNNGIELEINYESKYIVAQKIIEFLSQRL
ncbi:MAG: phosphopantothenoylcysteine decarboxylase [Leptospiraceae bacterium]|nr:phosphopantothenoylcysteine decarboxylase [Leptospiraceae bacterium]